MEQIQEENETGGCTYIIVIIVLVGIVLLAASCKPKCVQCCQDAPAPMAHAVKMVSQERPQIVHQKGIYTIYMKNMNSKTIVWVEQDGKITSVATVNQ
jgi:hypothetical protein